MQQLQCHVHETNSIFSCLSIAYYCCEYVHVVISKQCVIVNNLIFIDPEQLHTPLLTSTWNDHYAKVGHWIVTCWMCIESSFFKLKVQVQKNRRLLRQVL